MSTSELIWAYMVMNFFMCCNCFLGSPVAYGGVLVGLSAIMSFLVGVTSSSWYGYLIFLVYVGGLLVLFMYTIMLSSNYYTKMSAKFLFGGGFIALLMTVWVNTNHLKLITGVSCNQCSMDMQMSLFISLGLLLLLVFFTIIYIVLKRGKINIA
uniref:NADH dehydrogenase subunit 6 n=1 Tax=Orcula dolium TaxID=1331962 RepID=A0A1W5IHG0_9EUPU|nr:NADH dehydrogenase subunit 6 [Orcula dolium]AIR76273.1 NADH dehydrogenase subunit 6 [Orcula dolium]